MTLGVFKENDLHIPGVDVGLDEVGKGAKLWVAAHKAS